MINTSKPRTLNNQPLVGAHQSIAGGVYTAFERAQRAGCVTLQVFVKNNNRWKGKPLTDEDIANYKTTASKSNIAPVVAHSCYLINPCAVDPDILTKSRETFLDELYRCEQLGIPYFNFHPGAHLGKGEDEGIKRIIESLNIIHSRSKNYHTMSVLETTAGQGSAIGYRFEHLRRIIDGVDETKRMAVCIDTCHIFAAGYDIRTQREYERTMKEFDDVVGRDRLVAIHANDSKREMGSRIDRHEHIGKGAIGREGFRLLMQDERLTHVPKILETPKGEDLKEDKMNLKLLRSLAEVL